MRIAVIGLKGFPALGGAATVGENIIKHSKSDIQFTIYALDKYSHNSASIRDQDKLVIFKSISNNVSNIVFYYFAAAFHALIKRNYDLVHIHHGESAILIPLLKLRYNVLITTHGAFQVRKKWKKYKGLLLFLDKFFVKKADKVVCVSKSEQRKFRAISNINPVFIPNGIYRRLDSDIPKVNIDNFIFFSANRIIPTKGLDYTVKALKKIKYKGSFVIAGDLDQIPEYKKHLLELFQGLNIIHVGLIRDKKMLLAYLKSAKLFIFPSTEEAMSMMLLEAISVGAKIICSNIYDNKAILSDEEALFFKSGDINDLSSKISFALQNYNLMEKKSEMLIRNNAMRPDWKDISLKYESLFNELTGY